ncbi:hypothetical protein GCM10027413_24890 [Conyzicola nivalis]|uniref:Uncharacterized protein n=1 Tax=Conyzicola nivalis TaxID=1477021 RepID=A0A916SAE3_9MICO|nr:hypothetical protein [Conyzicola nivalis]GGA90687.1 hypothetical protein GCM10010979_01730 [Conyzicola nivalis]
MSKKLWSSGRIAVLTVAALVALTGCVDDRPTVGPESAADVRPAARASVVGATTLPTTAGLSRVKSRVHDACGIGGVGFQPADVPRNYRCGVGSVALYSIEGATAVEAATLLDAALTSNECTSAEQISSNPALFNAGNGATSAEQVIESFYECTPGGVIVHFGVADDPGIEAMLPYFPYVPSGTDVEMEPAISVELLRAAMVSGNRFVAVLEVSEDYFETDVCDGVHVCQ